MKKSLLTPFLLFAAMTLSGCSGCDRDIENEMKLDRVENGSVTFDAIYLSSTGFVAVYEEMGDGKTGALVGQSALLPYDSAYDVSIPFKSTPGGKYIAVLKVDNGDGAFTDADKNAVNQFGDVTTSFEVPAEPAGDAAKDSLTLGKVENCDLTVDSVVMAKPGFVVAYNAVNGEPRETVGSSALLPAGESNDVKVPAKCGGDHLAMLRADNGDGISNDADMPVNDAGGQTVMKPF